MRVKLKGLASATKKLADGSKRTYWYAWRGGPKIDGAPGSPEFMAAYHVANAQRRSAPEGIFAALISAYRASPAYLKLAGSTRANYAMYLKLIEVEFGAVPIAALADPRMRGDFLEWRDGFAETPRKADYAWTTLARVLSFAKDRGKLAMNVCERGGRLYASDRSECVWSEDDLRQLFEAASPALRAVVMLALWTGQRQGDLLALPWSAYDGMRITLRQSKSRRAGKAGRLITIPVAKPLKTVLDALRVENETRAQPSATILVSGLGRPWSSDGFKTSWSKTLAKAGLGDADLHFHDLRGTAVTRLALAACTVPEIAAITGHAMKTVEAVLDRYLSRDVKLAESAIMKLEANETRSEIANRLQTEAFCSRPE